MFYVSNGAEILQLFVGTTFSVTKRARKWGEWGNTSCKRNEEETSIVKALDKHLPDILKSLRFT